MFLVVSKRMYYYHSINRHPDHVQQQSGHSRATTSTFLPPPSQTMSHPTHPVVHPGAAPDSHGPSRQHPSQRLSRSERFDMHDEGLVIDSSATELYKEHMLAMDDRLSASIRHSQSLDDRSLDLSRHSGNTAQSPMHRTTSYSAHDHVSLVRCYTCM